MALETHKSLSHTPQAIFPSWLETMWHIWKKIEHKGSITEIQALTLNPELLLYTVENHA